MRRIFKTLWKLLSIENKWVEIQVSSDRRPEPILGRHNYLRSCGIRCYMHNLTSPSGRGISIGMMSLRVHRDDLPKANQLLANYQGQ